MTPDDFKNWRKAIGFSPDAAAEALDVSRSTIDLFESENPLDGEYSAEIPKSIALACTALYHKLDQWSG